MPQWIDETIPLSTRFDDTYYSKVDGLGETDHVFIDANGLPELWRTQSDCQIAELGFGTGLNFLRTVQRWREIAGPQHMLHFHSFEQYPLTAAQMAKSHSRWPQLEADSAKFCELLARADQITRMDIQFEPNVLLTVHLGDANVTLPARDFLADAWYLDGFSPAKNPQLWNLPLMEMVAERTKPNGRFATYTAAGFVKRNLISAGFEVSKVGGFGTKREMLCGWKV